MGFHATLIHTKNVVTNIKELPMRKIAIFLLLCLFSLNFMSCDVIGTRDWLANTTWESTGVNDAGEPLIWRFIGNNDSTFIFELEWPQRGQIIQTDRGNYMIDGEYATLIFTWSNPAHYQDPWGRLGWQDTVQRINNNQFQFIRQGGGRIYTRR